MLFKLKIISYLIFYIIINFKLILNFIHNYSRNRKCRNIILKSRKIFFSDKISYFWRKNYFKKNSEIYPQILYNYD